MNRRDVGRFRASVRGEYFEMRDKDTMRRNYDNAEDGYAVTCALAYEPRPRTRITLETQYVDHEQPVRAVGGEPLELEEWLLRLNLRLFL